MTAAAWKTSAGAAARMPVALAANLNQTIKEYKRRGVFVVGLDGDGDVSLPNFQLFDKPLLVVVGSEGKGLSRSGAGKLRPGYLDTNFRGYGISECWNCGERGPLSNCSAEGLNLISPVPGFIIVSHDY